MTGSEKHTICLFLHFIIGVGYGVGSLTGNLSSASTGGRDGRGELGRLTQRVVSEVVRTGQARSLLGLATQHGEPRVVQCGVYLEQAAWSYMRYQQQAYEYGTSHIGTPY